MAGVERSIAWDDDEEEGELPPPLPPPPGLLPPPPVPPPPGEVHVKVCIVTKESIILGQLPVTVGIEIKVLPDVADGKVSVKRSFRVGSCTVKDWRVHCELLYTPKVSPEATLHPNRNTHAFIMSDLRKVVLVNLLSKVDSEMGSVKLDAPYALIPSWTVRIALQSTPPCSIPWSYLCII